jgi:hypothetical protein
VLKTGLFLKIGVFLGWNLVFDVQFFDKIFMVRMLMVVQVRIGYVLRFNI